MKKILLPAFLLVVLGLTSCSLESGNTRDVLTQKVIKEGKTPITVLVKSAFSINAFEKAVEEEFPQIDIVQVGNYTSDMGIAEYEARMEHDDLTDIVMTWPLEVGKEYWEERLLDLSSLSLTANYTTSFLDNISKNGKLYYLPGPSQMRGIVYNKTMFEENGWEVPNNFEEMIALCRTIEESGIRSLQLGLQNAEVLDTAFIGCSYEETYSKPENAQRIADYDNGIGSFADNYMPALLNFQSLIDGGVLKIEDLEVDYAKREEMFFTRKCAMIEDSVLIARMGEERTGIKDEFALMPFFNSGVDHEWVRLYPVCFIGANKHLAEKKNKDKYDMVMQVLAYISTPEGQKALSGDNDAVLSALKGVEPPDIPEIKDLLPAIEQGRYAIFPVLKNAQGVLRQGLAGMLKGDMTAEEVVKLVDKQNTESVAEEASPVIGKAGEDFSLIETGNFITDVMRERTGCEIALYLDNGKDGKASGKGLCAKLYKGDITELDLKRISPDYRNDEIGELCKGTMTGRDLLHTLEYAISVDNKKEGWFYYFSGLKMEFAPAAEPGNRIRKITDEAGGEIDPMRLYSVAVMDESVQEERIESYERTNIFLKEMLESAVQDKEEVVPTKDGRFVICEP